MFKRRPPCTDETSVKSGQFDPRLESIRGLAALMVAGAHALVVYPTHDWPGRCTQALRTFLNGDSAVAMFFVTQRPRPRHGITAERPWDDP